MAKYKKSLINITEAMAKLDNWRNGVGTKFKCGDVVERKEGEIGVIAYLSSEIENYQIKWYKGPNPWDFIEGKGLGNELKLSKKPNPLKYTNAQRYPGPSSNQIEKLNKTFNSESKFKKVKTSKDVDKYIQILEEEMGRVKDYDVNFDDIDSVVDETLEEDTSAASIIDNTTVKHKKLIDEE